MIRRASGSAVNAALLLFSGAAALPLTAEDAAVLAARHHHQTNGATILADYASFLALPNVASDVEAMEANARHIVEAFERRGAKMEIWQQDGVPPIVYGELRGAAGSERTVGVYFHYDGQPVVPEEWTFDPWSATLVSGALESGGEEIDYPAADDAIDPEWRIYGRGAGDDKAPFAAILGAIDALEAAGIERRVNLKFFFEGEEEAGSPHLESYMREHADKLEVDLWLICDGPVHQSRRPQLVFGVRGYTGLDITVYGAARYLHSGHYGNWAPNPALRLAELLASMKNDEARVDIADFFQDSIPPTPEEFEIIKSLPHPDEQLRRELLLAEGSTDGAGAPLAVRLVLPSLNIRGMKSAEVGAGARNVIPTEATASLDIRLVKGDDPARILDVVERHIERQGYHVVHEEPDADTRLAHPKIARVDRREGYPAARTPLDTAEAQFAIEAARRVAGEELILMPSLGGSLPLYLFESVLGSPMVIVPIANHDNNQHAPDENLRLANLWYGIEMMAALFTPAD